MKIDQIWDELKDDKSGSTGLLLRRYSGSASPEVFVALQQPEKLLCIAFVINSASAPNISSLSRLQEINVSIIPNFGEHKKSIFAIKLINNQHRDIFSVVCEDLIASIITEKDERKLINIILSRLEKWKSLFTRAASQGLTPEEQRGLYGELYFLRKFLEAKADSMYLNILESWTGPEKQLRDFQLNNWAVEVKTTHGNNHQKVNISNERQLDNTNLFRLYLYHLSLEVMPHSSETLNQIIDNIYEILKSDEISMNRFKCKLFEAGYFDINRNLYITPGYQIRQSVFFNVENDFPRIQEREIRPGVGDVKYSIVISQCKQFIVTDNSVIKNLELS